MSDAANTTERLANQIADTVTERARVYGAPENNFGSIADFWRTWIATRYGMMVPLDATDVGLMSALIKVARLAETPGHEDSALDAATYLLLGYGCYPPASEPVSEGEPPVVVDKSVMPSRRFVHSPAEGMPPWLKADQRVRAWCRDGRELEVRPAWGLHWGEFPDCITAEILEFELVND